jgi:DNA-binding transcriptional ArsR family regulator
MKSLTATEAHVAALGALAHLSRLRAFFHLVRAGDEVAAGEIAAALHVPGPTLSHHLDLLRRAGLVTRRKQARWVFYAVNRPMVSDLVRLLTSCC